MAMIKCDECDAEVSDKAANCPACGNPITKEERQNIVVDNSATHAILAATQKKSMAAALILTILFGPLGLLYASVPGGLIMIVVAVVGGFLTFGLGAIVAWIGSIIWAAVAVNSKNSKIDKALMQIK